MSSPRRIGVLCCLVALAVVGWVPAVAAAAEIPITVQVLVGVELGGAGCITGLAPADNHVRVTLRSHSGQYRNSFHTRSADDGSFQGCFPPSAIFDAINGGDVLSVRADDAQRVIPIPKLIKHINRVTDNVRGHAVPGAEIGLTILHQWGFSNGTTIQATATADSNGRYRAKLKGKVNLIGADEVEVAAPPCSDEACTLTPGTDRFITLAGVPVVIIAFGSNRLFGFAGRSEVRFKLHDADGDLKARASASVIILSEYFGRLVDRHDNPVYPSAGDWLSANLAGDMQLQIPASDLRASSATDTVSGQCMAHAPYEVTYAGGVVSGRAAADGTFSRYIGKEHDIVGSDVFVMACRYPSGDDFTRSVQAGL